MGAVEERQVEESQLSLQPLDQSALQTGHVGRHARLRAARQQAVNEERLAQLLQSSGRHSWLFFIDSFRSKFQQKRFLFQNVDCRPLPSFIYSSFFINSFRSKFQQKRFLFLRMLTVGLYLLFYIQVFL